MSKYRAAVIGCGNIGAATGNYNKAVQPGTHAGAYLDNKDTNLSALVEKDIKRHDFLKKNYPQVPLYTSTKKMLKEVKPDIVSVAASTQFHFSIVKDLAEFKIKAILCEKPLAYNIKDAKRMVKLCKKSKSLLIVNHQRRFDPLLVKWSERIKKGFLGGIYQGNAYYYNGLFNNGTHLIDMLLMYLGEVDAATGEYNKQTSWNPKDKNVDGSLLFRNKARVTVHSLSKNYGYFGLTLFGEKGMLRVSHLGFTVEYRKKIKNRFFKGFYGLSRDIQKEGRPRSMIKHSVKHIIRVLEKKEKPKSTGEDGLKTMLVLEAMCQSAKSKGKKVKVK